MFPASLPGRSGQEAVSFRTRIRIPRARAIKRSGEKKLPPAAARSLMPRAAVSGSNRRSHTGSIGRDCQSAAIACGVSMRGALGLPALPKRMTSVAEVSPASSEVASPM